ncbi:MAG: choice-of-anchor J domain-containing protein [Bacteroidota bacterium]
MRASIFVFLFATLTVCFSQKNCGTIVPPPGEFEEWVQEKLVRRLSRIPLATQASSEITIPVVVHVLHQGEEVGEGSNLSVDRIRGQIDSLTVDFRRLNADTINTPSAFLPVAADVEINFVLAYRDPKGNPTDGIVRVNASRSFIPDRISDLIQMRSLSHWPAEDYFNIYCADLSTNLIGFATFPETDGSKGSSSGQWPYLDAVYMDHQYFGVNPDAPAFESRGRTLTHEVGHFLGLRHIWGDGNCTRDDFIADTPLADFHNGGYSSPCTFPNPDDDEVCVEGEPEMFQNYMDYTDDICMNLFTQGQKDCMRVVAANSPRRASLVNSSALSPVLFADNDLAINKIISPDFANCGTQITPIVEVINHGKNQIDEYEVTLLINNVEVFTISRATLLQSFGTETISFPNQILASSSNRVGFRVKQINGVTDENSANDSKSIDLEYTASLSLPFIQDFESGNELLGNVGSGEAWDVVLAPRVSPSNRALVFQSFDNNSAFGKDLVLTTPPLDLNGVSTATLSFKYAYSGRTNDIFDLLSVTGSADCGATYPDELFSEIGQDLQTAIPTQSAFVPSNELEWQQVILNISDYQNTDGVRFRFSVLNGSNNIYLDDIQIEQTNILSSDISLEAIQGPLITCNENVELELEVRNAGSDEITSFSITTEINEQTEVIEFDNVSISYQEYGQFPISISSLSRIENLVSVSVGSVNGRLDESSISNVVETSVNINSSLDEFPLTIDFEEDNDWVSLAPQGTSLWEFENLDGNTVLKANAFSEQTLGLKSHYISPALSSGGLDSAGLFFRLSYALRPGFNDQFSVLLSDDCGENFNVTLLEANSDSIAIRTESSLWQPTSDEDWKTFSLDLSQAIGIGDSIRLAFVMVNGNGNALYLDDISIRGNEPPTYQDVFRVFPNPARFQFSLGLNLPEKEAITLEVSDMSGKLMSTQVIGNAFNQIIEIPAPTTSGLYFVRLRGRNFVQTQKLFVEGE